MNKGLEALNRVAEKYAKKVFNDKGELIYWENTFGQDYAIIDDIINGKPEKILVLGTTDTTDRSNIFEKQKTAFFTFFAKNTVFIV